MKLKKSKKVGYICLLFFLIPSTFYFYFTNLGSARLTLILSGYPKEAFETGFEELKYNEEKNLKRYIPIQKINLQNGSVDMINIHQYGWLKFSEISKKDGF